MIDIENIVFTAVKEALTDAGIFTSYPNADIRGESIDVPKAFPCVTVEEISNSVLERTQTESLTENHAVLGYQINIYTNNSTKKSLAKQIANIVDAAMGDLKFTRTLRTPTPNIDTTIYRLTMRYEGIVGQPIEIGGEDVYPIYRR